MRINENAGNSIKIKRKQSMKYILNKLFEHQTLSYDEARMVLKNMAEGKYNESEMAAFLSVFIMRGIKIPELKGFRDALHELCIRIDLSDYNTIDLCGTGGDGKNTFNISTLSSFVVAGAGYKVTKHGNYGVSGISGSSNMLEYYGYTFTNNADLIKKQIDKANICFLHAPLFHPALKNVGQVRRNLKVKTFFNMLGPMVNPSFPQNQLVGVFSLEVARLYQYLYQETSVNFLILHSLDGYDEVSLTSQIKMISNRGEKLLSPAELGMQKLEAAQISGGESIEEAAAIFMDVLENRASEAKQNVVRVNSALAIQTIDSKLTYNQALDKATESLKSKKALNTFKILLSLR
jgi:anthranilate phosphoribosyltransferase